MSVADMDAYLGRVRALVWAVEEHATGVDASTAHHLIEHGEPAEGLRSLAWALVEGGHRISPETYDALLDLTEGLVERSDLPPGLSDIVDRS